jgi:hypothetical protein
MMPHRDAEHMLRRSPCGHADEADMREETPCCGGTRSSAVPRSEMASAATMLTKLGIPLRICVIP